MKRIITAGLIGMAILAGCSGNGTQIQLASATPPYFAKTSDGVL